MITTSRGDRLGKVSAVRVARHRAVWVGLSQVISRRKASTAPVPARPRLGRGPGRCQVAGRAGPASESVTHSSRLRSAAGAGDGLEDSAGGAPSGAEVVVEDRALLGVGEPELGGDVADGAAGVLDPSSHESAEPSWLSVVAASQTVTK
jgi:hypothetical protein